MDTRLLDLYNRELKYAREMGAEFAAAYPRIASRLGLRGTDCDDPYVERLLEGFAFLAARIQLKLDARHPQFTQHLLEAVYPGWLSPVPACAVVEFAPVAGEGSLLAGVRIPRDSELRSQTGKTERTGCQFRTCHDVELWPLQLRDLRYISGAGAIAALGLTPSATARAALRLILGVPEGVDVGRLPLEELPFFIKAGADLTARLFEQIGANCVGVAIRAPANGAQAVFLTNDSVVTVGLEDDQALLPAPAAGFEGYRLLQEYFAFPERLFFFKVKQLRAALGRLQGRELELTLLFDRAQPALENTLDASHLRLYCTPIVNLFPRTLDRVHVSVEDTEMHVMADRSRPMDFEIHSLTEVRGIGSSGEVLAVIEPLHRVHNGSAPASDRMFYTLQRRPRLMSTRQQQTGHRTQYLGSEVYVSIVDGRQRQFSGELRQLDVKAMCTNRDLPLFIAFGKFKSDFVLDGAAPVDAVRCIAGPSTPRASPAYGDSAWRLISHLSLNYLSLSQADGSAGPEMLRELLTLYADANDAVAMRQIEGVRGIHYRPAVRRIPSAGPIVYGRGLEILLGMEDAAFEGTGLLPLASVLERFFARYASINSFTELRLSSLTRGEVKRWAPRIGKRQIL